MKRLVLITAFMLGVDVYAQTPDYRERGLPPIRFYPAAEYGARYQNWGFAQHPDGTLVVANDGAILLFNGVQWRRIATPGNVVCRSVAVAPDGTIWVGLRGDMGYLAPDSRGQLEFVSIKDELPPDTPSFTDVWHIEATDDGVFFQAYSVLIRRTEEGITFWQPNPESSFYPLVLTGNEIYVTETGPGRRGILKLEGNNLVPVIARDDEAALRMARLFTRQDDNSALFLDQRYLFHVVESDGYARQIPTVLDAFLQERTTFGGRILATKHIAVWTYGGGVALMDQGGALVDVLDDNSGLSSSLSYTAYGDREGGLWLGQDIGITRVEPFSGVSVFNADNGLIGNVRAIQRFNGDIYAVTDRALFRLQPAAADGSRRARFERENMSAEGWALLEMDNSLLIATGNGLFELRDGSIRQIHSGNINRIHRSRIDPDLVYLAGRAGFISIRKNGQNWETLQSLKELPAHQILSMEDDENGDVWMGTRDGSILKWSHGSPTIEVYGSEHGLSSGFSSVRFFDDRVRFLTTGGLRQLDTETGVFVPDPLFGAEVAHGDPWLYYFAKWDDGALLVFSEELSMSLRYAEKMEDGTYRISAHNPFPELNADMNALQIEDGVLWVGTSDGRLLRYAYHEQVLPERTTLSARIEGVYVHPDSLLYGGYGPYNLTLNPGTSALRFVYSAPTLDSPESIRYRVRLAGLDHEWSAWTTETRKDYTNLSAGSYTFHVEAEDPLGRVITPVGFSFVIKPFWYETLLARSVFLLLILATGVVLAQRGPAVAQRVWAKLPHKRVVSHYRLEEMIGSGGAGQVWRARNLSSRPGEPRELAVKLLHMRVDPESSEGHQRLRREADLLASFEHPNIVRVYEAGVWKGTPFVAMDLLRGETLRHRVMRDGPLPVDEALVIFTQLADALKTVHEKSVIHRDVKSENVMLLEDGSGVRLVLMDFGLARGTHLTTLTQLGQLLGTLGYVSPEQAMGQDAGEQSDVFSFGVVMYETLTGRLPFVAENEIGMLHAIFNHEPKSPRELVGDVSTWLDTLVMACLSKEPSDRPGSMSEVLDRLAAG